ncbi:hypothetical protein [Nostoc sp. C117]|uniref:hypothetical protein n=1 Tax=Nostoc sp. C117 TaxID=3349875 RepID=UPI00370DD442
MDATVTNSKDWGRLNRNLEVGSQNNSGFSFIQITKQELPMRVIVTVVEKIISEAHIDIPDGLNQSAIKQHIVDRYNTGEMSTDMNIFQVDFESISARIVKEHSSTKSPSIGKVRL